MFFPDVPPLAEVGVPTPLRGRRDVPSFTSSVSFINRFPLHTSQVTYTVGRKCISTATSPLPWHASQRPAFTLKLKRPGPQPRARASSVMANISRMCVQAPVYVAGFERGVRPIGDWSIRMARLRDSVPLNSLRL